MSQGVLEPPSSEGGIVLDVHVDTLAEPELSWVAVLDGQLVLHHRDLFGEPSGGLGSRAHETVAVLRGAPHPGRRVAAEPHRRVRLLHRLGLHRRSVEPPEASLEVDLRVGPAALHQRQCLVEARDRLVRVYTKGRERPLPATGGDAHLHAAMTEAVQRADRLREVQRVVQRQDEHRAAKPQPFGASRGIGERLERREDAGCADHLLLHPAALEHPELLDAAKVGAEGRLVEAAVASVLRDRDRELHGPRAYCPDDPQLASKNWTLPIGPQPVLRLLSSQRARGADAMPDAFTGAVWMSRASPRHRHASPSQSYGHPFAQRHEVAFRGSGYGPVPAGRWALTPLATRNSAATSRVAASAPSGNT